MDVAMPAPRRYPATAGPAAASAAVRLRCRRAA